MQRYLKFAAQIVVTALSVLVAALADDTVDAAEWINVLIAALGAVSVLGAGEVPETVWAHMKTYVAAATAGAVLLVSFVSDGGSITTSEWLQVALAAAGAIGVAAVKGPKLPDSVVEFSR
jgi:hypothetical protein